jgi:hypothetical protein
MDEQDREQHARHRPPEIQLPLGTVPHLDRPKDPELHGLPQTSDVRERYQHPTGAAIPKRWARQSGCPLKDGVDLTLNEQN